MQQNLKNQNRVRGRRRARRGMGLVATMLVLMGILSIMLVGAISGGKSGGSVMDTAGNAVQASRARNYSAASFNMAEAGIQYTMAWLSAQAAPPANTASFAPGLNFGSGAAAATVGTPPAHRLSPISPMIPVPILRFAFIRTVTTTILPVPPARRKSISSSRSGSAAAELLFCRRMWDRAA